MRRSARVHALCLVALSAVAAAEEVTLTFAWPDGLSMTVVTKATGFRKLGNGATQSLDHLDTATLTATREGEKLVVRRTRAAVPPPPPLPYADDGRPIPLPFSETQALLDHAAEEVPVVVIGKDGGYLEARELEKAGARVAEVLGRARLDGALRDRIASTLLSPESFAAIAESTWRHEFASWAGQRFEVGTWRKEETSAPVPGVNTPVALTVERRIARRLPCPGGGGSCVELELVSTVRPEDVKKALEAGAKASGGRWAIGDVQMESRHRAIVEPATLVPHEMETFRSATMQLLKIAPADAVVQEQWTRTQTFRRGR